MNSDNGRAVGQESLPLGPLRWVPWLAALAVFALAAVLYWTGVLDYPAESRTVVELKRPVPGLRAYLRPGAISPDGLRVTLPGDPSNRDFPQVMEAFRRHVGLIETNLAEVVGPSVTVPAPVVARDIFLRVSLPWAGLAFGVGVLCHVWIRLGSIKRVAEHWPKPGPGGTKPWVADVGEVRIAVDAEVKKRSALVEAVEKRIAAVEARTGTAEASLKLAVGRVEALEAQVKRLDRPVVVEMPPPDPRIPMIADDLARTKASVGEVSKALGRATNDLIGLKTWRDEVKPHLEDFGRESQAQIQARDAFKARVERARTKVSALGGGNAGALPEADPARGRQALAELLGVPEVEKGTAFEAAILEAVGHLSKGPPYGVILEGAPGVGKGAILRALPAFFDPAWKIPASERLLLPEEGWFRDAMWGFPLGLGFKEGILGQAVLTAIERSDRPWILIDELNELPEPFKELFSDSKETLFAKSAQREVPIYADNTGLKKLALPSRLRVVMARNPAIRRNEEYGDFLGDPAWQGRIAVVRIPPLDAASEERLLTRWLGRETGFSSDWRLPETRPPKLQDWLPRFCAVLEASRKSHNGGKDPGWRYAETGTGVTRQIVQDAAADPQGILKGLERQLQGKILTPIRDSVLDAGDLKRFRQVLTDQGFKELAATLT